MSLEWTSSPTASLALATAIVGLLAALVRAAAWITKWVYEDRIKNSLDKMDADLELARRLEEIGEWRWAAEQRKRAQMFPLRCLARYEVNRASHFRFVAEYIGWLLYLTGIALEIVSVDNAWLTPVGPALMCAALLIGIWWVVTQPGIERAVTQRAQEKFEEQQCAGMRLVAPKRSLSVNVAGGSSVHAPGLADRLARPHGT